MSAKPRKVRVAAVGDLHYRENRPGTQRPLFEQLSEAADIVVFCGDLTDHGLPAEAHLLAHDLIASLRIPAVGVLGNHDVESGQEAEVTKILCEAGVTMLDGDSCEFGHVGFAGVKGFGGGFGRSLLQSWGEATVKSFVQEAIGEALKLENALARLRTEHRVAVLHYAPIHATVEGEPPEIVPFLGTSRLAEPIDQFRASVAVHGHAHHGAPEGQTAAGIPVHNVSLTVRQSLHPDKPFLVLEFSDGG